MFAALEWVCDKAADLRIRRDRVAVQGTSAGGCIAAVVTLMNRDRGGEDLALQVLEVPVTDLTGRTIDFRATWALGIPMVIAVRELVSVAKTYFGDRSRAADPCASPLLASTRLSSGTTMRTTTCRSSAARSPPRGGGIGTS